MSGNVAYEWFTEETEVPFLAKIPGTNSSWTASRSLFGIDRPETEGMACTTGFLLFGDDMSLRSYISYIHRSKSILPCSKIHTDARGLKRIHYLIYLGEVEGCAISLLVHIKQYSTAGIRVSKLPSKTLSGTLRVSIGKCRTSSNSTAGAQCRGQLSASDWYFLPGERPECCGTNMIKYHLSGTHYGHVWSLGPHLAENSRSTNISTWRGRYGG